MKEFNFTWDNSFETGYKTIDLHHLKLIEMINRLATAYILKKDKNILTEILFDLENYVLYHFKEEEKILSNTIGEISDKHKAEHEKFIQVVRDLKFDYTSGKIQIGTSLFDFLKEWLINHILGTDKEEFCGISNNY
jgi:hemerythrin